MGVTEILGLALSIVDQVMGMLPNYEQKKRKEFYKLKRKYEEELVKDFSERDHDLILTYQSELRDFLKAFQKEL